MDTIPQSKREYQPNTEPIFYTYLLLRPDDQFPDGYVPFYVGKGHAERVNDHFACSRNHKSCRHLTCRVIRKVWNEGKEVRKEFVAEGIFEESAFLLEKFFISMGAIYNWPLVNKTFGGEGTTGFKYTPEQRIARSAITRSYASDPEMRVKMGRGSRGRKHSEAERIKRGQSMKLAYMSSDELIQQKSEMSKKNWSDPEYRRKMQEGMDRPEVKEKQRKARLGKLPANTKSYPGFLAPDGVTIYENVFNLAAFCREHNLSKPKMCNVAQGKRKSHQGWTLYPPLPEKPPTYYHTGFQSPSGKIFTNIVSLTAFCREHGLQHSNMTLVAQGKQADHKGWTRFNP